MTQGYHHENGKNIVTLQGEVDLEHSAEVRRLLLDCVGQGDDVLVDMSGVSYIDSSGVANLIEALQSARGKGKQFGLVAISEQTRRVLSLARLDMVFVIHADLPSAIHSAG